MNKQSPTSPPLQKIEHLWASFCIMPQNAMRYRYSYYNAHAIHSQKARLLHARRAPYWPFYLSSAGGRMHSLVAMGLVGLFDSRGLGKKRSFSTSSVTPCSTASR